MVTADAQDPAGVAEGAGFYAPANAKAKEDFGQPYTWPRGFKAAAKWQGKPIDIPFALKTIQ